MRDMVVTAGEAVRFEESVDGGYGPDGLVGRGPRVELARDYGVIRRLKLDRLVLHPSDAVDHGHPRVVGERRVQVPGTGGANLAETVRVSLQWGLPTRPAEGGL